MRNLLLICLALCFAGAAFAASKSKLSEVRIEPDEFSDYRAAVEAELRGGELYREMASADRDEVLAILQRMDEALAGVEAVDGLESDAKLGLFNDQERLRVLLGQAEENSRMVCSREKVVGSHMPKKICMTVAERRRAREDSQDFMRTLNSSRPMPLPTNQ